MHRVNVINIFHTQYSAPHFKTDDNDSGDGCDCGIVVVELTVS